MIHKDYELFYLSEEKFILAGFRKIEDIENTPVIAFAERATDFKKVGLVVDTKFTGELSKDVVEKMKENAIRVCNEQVEKRLEKQNESIDTK